jgi:hypothetical protein
MNLVYAIYSALNHKPQDAAKAHKWIYVGKTTIQPHESINQACERILNEHSTNPNRHGQLLEEAITSTPFVKCFPLETYDPTTLLEGNPTQQERAWMDRLEAMGAIIKNTLR